MCTLIPHTSVLPPPLPAKAKKSAPNEEFRTKVLFVEPRTGIIVRKVDKKFVKKNLFIDFTEGGNNSVYKFIPPKEIWVDDTADSDELLFTLIHELHERRQMISEKWPYAKAHDGARRVELEARKNPTKAKEILEREWKSQPEYR